MFVFEAVDSGALALLDVATKDQLPFDEYVVVAGLVQSSRQLTCLGGRVKSDGKRRLLVVPLAQAQDTSTPSVQVLDVGEVALNFLQGVRACFPTLVKKNPLAESMDDDSDSDEEEGEAHKKQKHDQDDQPAEAANARQEAVKYMSQTRVKVLATLDQLFSAFQIADPTNVQTSLRNDPSVPKNCQLLCMDCPALGTAGDGAYAAVPHAFSSSTAPPEPLNIGVLFSEVATSKEKEQFLHIPVPRSPPLPAPGAQGDDYVQESFQDATVLTFGTKREATAHGGGKTCEEMIKNIRMRHASGTFCTLVLPTKSWEQVADAHKAFLPQVCELQGELRLRRLMGNAPCGAPIELLLGN
ncbi:Phospholipase D [Phytophthora pseudosyringae]|uniref:Phospholipase D n=1 Tax=Phytophthora pseudosyringae TaxID=221518 RepID=A0A8T1W6N1_9STRA|nr:Phospholipase D [Phytophthora pseudosyringae]